MKIGIITLHKVLNFGSALQAYALQRFLESVTHDKVELIDYKCPNEFQKKHNKFTLHTLQAWAGNMKDYLLRGKFDTLRRFNQFYKSYFHLTSVEYKSGKQIEEAPPIYDLYITGSDQVWNPETLCNDPVMYCSFAPQNAKIISFASSFTNKTLPQEYHQEIRDRLLRYSKIGVREQSSLMILKDLELPDNIPTAVNCDPTLLLGKDEYHSLAKNSKIKIDEEYILVYGLNYAYNPEPALSRIVDEVAGKLHLKVYTLWLRHSHFEVPSKSIYGIGPCEFCYLFENAKFVVTSSFHGTMFSIINRKPFASITPSGDGHDSRIKDALDKMGLSNNYVKADSDKSVEIHDPYTSNVETKIAQLINDSKEFLLTALQI